MQKLLVIHQSLTIDNNLAKVYNSFGNNFEIKFVCPKKIKYGLGFGEGFFDKKEFVDFKNIEVIPVNLINYKNIFFRTLYSFDLYKIINNFKPDIIHCYTEIFSPTLTQILFFKNFINKNIKVINYSWENLDQTKNMIHNIFGKYNARNINMVLCANDQSISEVIKFGVDNKKINKIYWGIDFGNFKFIKHSIDGKTKFKIGFIGRLLKDKGLQNLIESVSILGENFSLNLIGDGSDKEYFMDLSKKLNINKRINFIGKVEYSKLKEYISKFDIFVLPSISKPYWEEQFGRVLVEMMASGVPVIGSSSGAIPEVIGDRGLIFKEGISKDLADKVKYLSENKDLYNEFVLKAYDFALNNYSQEVFRKNLERIYKKI